MRGYTKGYTFGNSLRLVIELNELAKTLTDSGKRALARVHLENAFGAAVELAECHGDLLQLQGIPIPNGKAKRRFQQRLKELKPREKIVRRPEPAANRGYGLSQAASYS